MHLSYSTEPYKLLNPGILKKRRKVLTENKMNVAQITISTFYYYFDVSDLTSPKMHPNQIQNH